MKTKILRCALPAGSVLAFLAITSPSAAQERTTAPWKSFRFNDGFQASEGLGFRFSRSVASVAPDGTRVGANEPRYSTLTSVAGAPLTEAVRTTDGWVELIASGLAHDGVTPIMITFEFRAVRSYLDVFVGGSDTVVKAERTGEGRNRTFVDPPRDLMSGAVPGKRYVLTSGVVCHGLIVLFSTVDILDPSSQTWRTSSNAFIVSQDLGRTWSVAYESEPFAPGHPRGVDWCMQNWWPTERSVSPRVAYFAATDYCMHPNSPGGRFYIMRAKRVDASAPWELEPGAVAAQISNNLNQHIHTGGVVAFGDQGIRAFFVVGDGRHNNCVTSLISPDGSYDSRNWTVNSAYHGEIGTPGIEANQFVGCAPGPFANSAIVGGDLCSEHVMLLRMDEQEPHPFTHRLVGFPCVDMSRFTCFNIRTPTPELGGPYVANAEPYSLSVLPYSRRVLYSPDGLRWVQAVAPPSGGGYHLAHDEHLYFSLPGDHGFARTPVPRMITARPLIVGPGGLQRAINDPYISPGSMPRLLPLTRDASGRWIDQGLPLDPQPPTAGNVYRVQTTSRDASPWIGHLLPCGLPNLQSSFGDDLVQVRLWLHHADPSRSATLSVGIGDTVHAPVTYRSLIVSSIDGWVPITALHDLNLPTGQTPRLTIRSLSNICDDQTVYVALDNVQTGDAMPGYSMPPDTSLDAVGTRYPDEHASVTGLECRDAWTVTFGLQVPEDGFDFRTGSQKIWPLATIWADNQNFIELSVDSLSGQVWVTIFSRGVSWSRLISTPTTMVRGVPLLFSIAQPLGAAGLEISASVGGRDVTSIAIPTRFNAPPRLASPPREIRFWSQSRASLASSVEVATSPLLVWGGRIDEQRALSRTERDQLLRDLTFLSWPPP